MEGQEVAKSQQCECVEETLHHLRAAVEMMS